MHDVATKLVDAYDEIVLPWLDTKSFFLKNSGMDKFTKRCMAYAAHSKIRNKLIHRRSIRFKGMSSSSSSQNNTVDPFINTTSS